MTRYRFRFVFKRAATAAGLTLSLIVAGACSSNEGPDSKATRAEITIEGTTPNPLKLITSTDFYEQLNVDTGEYKAILITSDTVLVTTLPHTQTVDIGVFGSVYVELYQPEVGTATVHMKVDLDNGERYEQNATMADGAQLIYYFVYTAYSY